jgi:hypothetical protein
MRSSVTQGEAWIDMMRAGMSVTDFGGTLALGVRNLMEKGTAVDSDWGRPAK